MYASRFILGFALTIVVAVVSGSILYSQWKPFNLKDIIRNDSAVEGIAVVLAVITALLIVIPDRLDVRKSRGRLALAAGRDIALKNLVPIGLGFFAAISLGPDGGKTWMVPATLFLTSLFVITPPILACVVQKTAGSDEAFVADMKDKWSWFAQWCIASGLFTAVVIYVPSYISGMSPRKEVYNSVRALFVPHTLFPIIVAIVFTMLFIRQLGVRRPLVIAYLVATALASGYATSLVTKPVEHPLRPLENSGTVALLGGGCVLAYGLSALRFAESTRSWALQICWVLIALALVLPFGYVVDTHSWLGTTLQWPISAFLAACALRFVLQRSRRDVA